MKPYPRTPVGQFIFDGMRHARDGDQEVDLHPLQLPTGIVLPGSNGYRTRDKLHEAVQAWGDAQKPPFWDVPAEKLWSRRVRDACNMCGFCGEYLCWGREGPKSSTRASTIKELQDLKNAEIRTDAQVFEVMYDSRLRRATGVRYLDVSDPDRPRTNTQFARYVIISCGAVQTPRLLLMSGGPGGLGNRYGQVGRYAMFHLFGLSVTCVLPEELQGYLRGEFGHTGNTTSFEYYFVKDERRGRETEGRWWKAGTLTSTAKKNPLENADEKLRKGKIGRDLLREMELYTRKVELRLTGDDLPMARNRVDLDPRYVDEYGLPVARITRNFGPHEQLMFRLMEPKMRQAFEYYKEMGLIIDEDLTFSEAIVDLIGDHQMGTCRMGNDPTQSVLDRYCRLHEAPNVFVVDSSFMPTGFGLNPMVTVMANALRVGTWIVEESKRGKDLG
jgi:choline dehydrogenase-like flavoprotein